MGTAVVQWLRCCATNRKVAGSIPAGVIGIFHWHNPSDRTLTLGSTQPPTVPGVFPGGEGGRCVRLKILPPSCAVVRKYGNLNFLEPSGLLQACNATDLPFKSHLWTYILYLYYSAYVLYCGPGSSVGIATELRAGRSRWGRDFPPFQTGPGAHPASCKMDTGSFLGVKCGRGMLLTTHPLLVPRSWKSRAISLPTLWATPGL